MSQNNLYPLIYKPGIKRDGSTFQADYCTDGQWVRFQRGTIRKIGGMKGVPLSEAFFKSRDVTNVTIVPTEGTNNISYIVARDGLITLTYLNQNFEVIPGGTNLYNNISFPYVINWKSEIVIQGNNKMIVFVGSNNFTNINNTSYSLLLAGPLTGPLEQLEGPRRPNLKGLNGLLYTSNYLFMYGINGLVQWSKLANPTDFTNPSDRSITISNDSVIDAKAIRGGTNTPTILFWTLSSVVRCINTPDAGGNLQFQLDVLSRSSSILSTRCVVEYDGLFFWPGTNRFFQYNGIVQELANNMSLNYFFDNLDMERRQQVVGVKNTKYGEIWWFYPEKQNASRRNPLVSNGQNSRALIYNIRENAWYDTYISRWAAAYSEDFGFMVSYGNPLSQDANSTLFRHEYENMTPNSLIITENFTDLNTTTFKSVPIPSSVTTPFFSWAAFNPAKQLTGNDRWMRLITIEPDFILLPDNPDLKVLVQVKQYPHNVLTTIGTFDIPPTSLPQDNALNAKIDMDLQGRHMCLTFTTEASNFEMGHIMLSLGLGDGK